jgi:hypothetical protein
LQSRGVLVRINTGLNDRNETLPSVDAGILPGNSEAAFEDNLRAIIARVRQAWDAAALPPEQLYFLLTVSHPVATPDEQLLTQYRDAADRIASGTPSVASIRMDRLTTAGEMLASGWYQSGGTDRNHLTQAAYEVLASREWSTLKQVVERTCPADMNRDLETDMLDFLAFFNCFDTADIAADMDADGIVDFGQIQSGQLQDDNQNNVPDVCEYTVTGVIPVSGASSGGTSVIINGTNFPQNPAVLIGGSAATSVVRVSANRITAVTPAGLPGMTSVTVGNWVQPNAFYYRPECGSDLDQDGEVTAADIAIVLLDFGPCYATAISAQPEDSTPFMLREQTESAAPRAK